MSNVELIDWAFKGLFAVLAILWGRSQKQADALMDSKAEGLKRLVAHDRQALEILVNAKAADMERLVSDRAHALDRLFESHLANRDQRIGAIEKRIDLADERSSRAASAITGKIGEIEHRITIVEERRTPSR